MKPTTEKNNVLSNLSAFDKENASMLENRSSGVELVVEDQHNLYYRNVSGIIRGPWVASELEEKTVWYNGTLGKEQAKYRYTEGENGRLHTFRFKCGSELCGGVYTDKPGRQAGNSDVRGDSLCRCWTVGVVRDLNKV
ncbi:hypothetical protein AX774_g7922 [Zancudomyces culisetae]|uniref:Uncharacterized protein n=1 Tax=Zancudomyces culisetae TaxID=1213189 RepID=A0A1R1PCU8_ZANCU|nr:hypothetical protein AX774_g7922 [Zancudomyces culisetae]|eukprot:OMH78682.1 hypothetical protein AX774_g7922 [Zancudomyces culisetae]